VKPFIPKKTGHVSKSPNARPVTAGVDLTESSTEDMPPFMHLDPSDWH
jgi:hypothetical protein